MNWEECLELYAALRKDVKAAFDQGVRGDELGSIKKQVQRELAAAADTLAPETITELEDILKHEEKKELKYAVAEFFCSAHHLPQKLFVSFIRAAVYETDSCSNRYFISPCVATFGYREVIRALIAHFEKGNAAEKAGAADALYWARPGQTYINSKETLESQKQNAEISDLVEKMGILFLTEFVKNDDLTVRRSIIPWILNKDQSYPEDLHPLAEKAKAIALAYPPEEYIHQRILVHTGLQDILPCKPNR